MPRAVRWSLPPSRASIPASSSAFSMRLSSRRSRTASSSRARCSFDSSTSAMLAPACRPRRACSTSSISPSRSKASAVSPKPIGSCPYPYAASPQGRLGARLCISSLSRAISNSKSMSSMTRLCSSSSSRRCSGRQAGHQPAHRRHAGGQDLQQLVQGLGTLGEQVAVALHEALEVVGLAVVARPRSSSFSSAIISRMRATSSTLTFCMAPISLPNWACIRSRRMSSTRCVEGLLRPGILEVVVHQLRGWHRPARWAAGPARVSRDRAPSEGRLPARPSPGPGSPSACPSTG